MKRTQRKVKLKPSRWLTSQARAWCSSDYDDRNYYQNYERVCRGIHIYVMLSANWRCNGLSWEKALQGRFVDQSWSSRKGKIMTNWTKMSRTRYLESGEKCHQSVSPSSHLTWFFSLLILWIQLWWSFQTKQKHNRHPCYTDDRITGPLEMAEYKPRVYKFRAERKR